MVRNDRAVLAVAGALLLGGCGSGTGGDSLFRPGEASAPVAVHVTDAPLPSDRITSVRATFERVSLLRASGDPVELLSAANARTVDLLALRNGELATLANAAAPVGSYTGVRVDLRDVEVGLVGGSSLAVPGRWTVDAPIAFSVSEGARELLVDVDLAQSLALSGPLDALDAATFEPVVRTAVVGSGGRLNGVARAGGVALAGATVTARSSSAKVCTVANVDGSFAFLELPPGEWDVSTEASGRDPVHASATLAAGETRSVALEIVPPDGVAIGPGPGPGDPSDLELLLVSAQEAVQPGEQIRVTWQVRSSQPIKSATAYWGGISGVYSGVGTPQSSQVGGTYSFSEVFVAPSRAKTVYYVVRVVDALGKVVTSEEKQIRVEWTEMTGAIKIEKSLALPIPDNDPTGVTIPFSVAAVGSLANLQLRIDIAHPAPSDLVLDLVAPSGKTLRIFEQLPGQPSPTHVDGSHADLYGSFNGTFRTTGDVTTLFGESVQGTWKLRVVDRVPEGEGTVWLATLLLQLEARADDRGREMLPNLVTLPPDEVSLFFNTEGKHLRLSNNVANTGDGPLELRGEVDRNTGETKAYQRIFKLERDPDGTKRWVVARERLVGRFVFAAHKDHNHFHFDQFATYTLHDQKFQPVAASTKISHCLEDYKWVFPNVPNAVHARVYACTPTIQGISLGWSDYYGANLEGQSIKITGLPDGIYYLISHASEAFEESNVDKRDNSAATRLELKGSTVTVLERLDGVQLAERRAAQGAP